MNLYVDLDTALRPDRRIADRDSLDALLLLKQYTGTVTFHYVEGQPIRAEFPKQLVRLRPRGRVDTPA